MGATLGETIDRKSDNLRDSIAKQGEEIARLRVAMVWMTVGVTGFLAGLIALFEFIS